MDWKKENPKSRYIDDIKWEEAKQIAYLAAGEPEEFELTKLDAKCNGNNIPHVELHYRAFEPLICDGIESYIGIFHNLDVYQGRNFHKPYCQRELHEKLKEMQFD